MGQTQHTPAGTQKESVRSRGPERLERGSDPRCGAPSPPRESTTGGAPVNLDQTTLLVPQERDGAYEYGEWVLSLKPWVGKGKATITLRPVKLDEREKFQMQAREETPEQQEERFRRNHRRSVMRSRGLLMDYAQEYRLSYLWTLTYKGEGRHDWEAMVDDVRAFQRRFKETYPDCPYVIVPEWHPGGHGLHLHMGVGRFIPWQTMLALWTDGTRHPLAGTVKAPKTVKGKQTPQDCARYLAKYVSKTLNETVIRTGAKRFYRPHGQAVTIVRSRFVSELRAYTFAMVFFGGELPHVWDSRMAEGWEGPPVIAFDWNAPWRKVR